MKLLAIISLLVVGASCAPAIYDPFSYLYKHPKNDYYLIMDTHDTHDGRKIYQVYFPSRKVMEHMYAEEIGESLRTGKWNYNEDLSIKH